jgi:prepilin-type N-terminal cleavage/methylation domain-containing protein
MLRVSKGYTLVELVVVMLIFALVMTLISASFNRIVASSNRISKSVETEIGGLIGLELLRCDLESAGFGLPWALSGVTYQETAKGEMVSGYPGTAASSYNDAPPEPPRSYKSGNAAGYNQSDYLVLKGTPLAMNATSRSWAYLNYSSNTEAIIRPSKSGSELLLGEDERVIVLKSSVRSGAVQRELVTVGAGSNVFTLVYNQILPPGFLPKSREDQHLVYGVAPKADGTANNTLSYPFNRSDYYIKRTSAMTRSCAKNTGVLYKTTIDHPGEKKLPEGEELEGQAPAYTPYPILDCVADFQVLFMLETSNDGTLVAHNDIGSYSAGELRELLKEVRLYVMVQEGKQDPAYSYPIADPSRAIVVGDRVWTKQKFLANDWLTYHWKVYTIVVQPKNL